MRGLLESRERAVPEARMIRAAASPCLALCLALAASSFPAAAQSAPDPRPWIADIELAVRELPARHKDLYALVPKPEYEKRAAELLAFAAAPGRSRDELLAELSAFVASFGDGHTCIAFSEDRYVPLSLYAFEEGIYVLGAPKDRPELLGTRLTGVGGQGIEQAAAALARTLSRDNGQALASSLPGLLISPARLEGLGLAPRGSASYGYEFEDSSGRRISASLAPAPASSLRAGLARLQPDRLSPAKAIAPPTTSAYWLGALPGTRMLYLAYDSCEEDRRLSMEAFSRMLQRELATGAYDALFVDLRRNGGGDSRVFAPAEKVIGAAQAGGLRLFVGIGRQTFSSAVLNAMELRNAKTGFLSLKRPGATFVGEDSGGKPNHYGEVRQLELPRLGCALYYSTKRFVTAPGSDADALKPDLPAPPRFADYLAGRDAAIEAALAAMRR